jgi:cytochrome c556
VTPDAPAAKPASRPTVTSEYDSLAKLMQEGLHEPFTELSFTVWHDKPFNAEKYQTIARASLGVQKIAVQIPAFTRSSWSGEEIAYFENTALRLADLAGFLADSAQRHQQDHVVHYLMDLETTCQKCHSEFAPDLKF